jgi:D-3-phosphoglycerate dehydrogenase / 2-oxoglutarate reductase
VSPRPLVCVLDPIAADAMAWLAERAEVAGPKDPRAAAWPDHADGVIVRTTPMTAAAIGASRSLKVIAKHGVGVDNIDLAAARTRGIRVTNTPGANTGATAELTVALALAAARAIPQADAALRAGRPVPDAARGGGEIAGRTVGLVGMGRIATRVALILRAGFGCRVHAYSPRTPRDRFDAAGVEPIADLLALASASDLLSIHVPLTADTRGMIDATVLGALPHGAILVNTARGGIVDEAALARALAVGPLVAAASDVFDHEPPPPDHPLLAMPNFVATPHIGAMSALGMRNMGMQAAAAAITILDGGLPADGVLV